ncbi:IS256 family transposase, partial [Parafrankia sp. Ea1.12]|uniref:IS256 family transposase n=1 Tax=Parafrankia sp. Ea1.12 TaxID=573499 RepID=UPI001F45F4B4
MTETITDKPAEAAGVVPAQPVVVDEALAESLIERARADGLSLTGPGGMLGTLTKMVLEKALAAEMTAHLGYDAGDPAGRNSGNSRNGTRSKTLITEIGPVEIDVPRDRDGTFTPKLVAKRQRRLGGVEELVVSLVAKGLTTGEVQAHLAEVYGTDVSRQTISTITDTVIEGMEAWRARPLDAVYAVVFIDAIVVKIRDGQVANRPIYAAIGVTADGERDILGLWAGTGGEGAKHWQQILTDLKNRGVADVLILVCDGLTGLPDAVAQVWPATIVQTCIVHLLRNSFRYASKKDWPALAKDLSGRSARFCRVSTWVDLWGGRWGGLGKDEQAGIGLGENTPFHQ